MKRYKSLANILILLILCTGTLYAEDLIIPAVKAPSEIQNIHWDSNNNDFSYDVNGNTYIRDSFTLILKDSHAVTEGSTQSSDSNKAPLPGNIKTYSGVKDYCVTKDGNYIVADSTRTAGLYNAQGQKLKTYTCSNLIFGLNLTQDNDTLIIYDSNNTLHFYNAKTGAYIGYSPKFGTKQIKSVLINNDSTKALVSTADNSIYITKIQDVLFAPETVAPSIKQYPVMYNAENPNDRTKNVVTEFSVREIRTDSDTTETEYITSTREKAVEKQTFELDEEKNKKTDVVIVKQPEQEYFPPSVIEADKEVLISNKEKIQESKVTEYKIVDRTPKTVEVVPVEEPPVKPVDDTPKQYPVVEEVVKEVKKAPVTEKKEEKTVPTVKEEKKEASVIDQQPQYIILETTEEIVEEPKEVPVVIEEVKPKKQVVIKEPEPEEEEKEEKPEKKKKLFSDEDIKKYFKDGHGLLFDIGSGSMKDPYTMSFSIATAYLNYNLIYPFHFGGFTSLSLGMPKNDYPYKYANTAGVIHNPYLVDLFIAAPIGFSIYPFKNSLELYLEVQPGAALYKLWNGVLGSNSIAGKFFPVYRTSAKLGAAWDFINLTASANYDTVTGFTFEVYIGALINIGGSRTIGSMVLRKN